MRATMSGRRFSQIDYMERKNQVQHNLAHRLRLSVPWADCHLTIIDLIVTDFEAQSARDLCQKPPSSSRTSIFPVQQASRDRWYLPSSTFSLDVLEQKLRAAVWTVAYQIRSAGRIHGCREIVARHLHSWMRLQRRLRHGRGRLLTTHIHPSRTTTYGQRNLFWDCLEVRVITAVDVSLSLMRWACIRPSEYADGNPPSGINPSVYCFAALRQVCKHVPNFQAHSTALLTLLSE